MERAIEIQKNLYLCVSDYSTSFDKVKHSDLYDMTVMEKILESLEICTRNKRLQTSTPL